MLPPEESIQNAIAREETRLARLKGEVAETQTLLESLRSQVATTMPSLPAPASLVGLTVPPTSAEKVALFPIDVEIRVLIRRMAGENPTWGRRRIRDELRLLGYEIAELTVAKYMRRPSPRPFSTWRTFLEAHLADMVAVDFFVVPTLTFRLLFGFLILRHDRRELVHVNVTDHPTAAWTAQQLVETFPEESAPKYLLRDRDAIYGNGFARRVKGMGIHEVLIAPRAPWQNPFAERVIGSIRRECLDHVLVFNERHLRRLLRSYLAYYNATRPHQALHGNSPHPRQAQPPVCGRIVAIPQVGGLHHRYQRVA